MITNEDKDKLELKKKKYLKLRFKLTFLMTLGIVLAATGLIMQDEKSIAFYAIGAVLTLSTTPAIFILDRKTKVSEVELAEFSKTKSPFNKNKYK